MQGGGVWGEMPRSYPAHPQIVPNEFGGRGGDPFTPDATSLFVYKVPSHLRLRARPNATRSIGVFLEALQQRPQLLPEKIMRGMMGGGHVV